MAERLFNDNALASRGGVVAVAAMMQQAGFVQLLDNQAKLARGGGEVEQTIIAKRFIIEAFEQAAQLRVIFGAGEIPLRVKDAGCEAVPGFGVHGFGSREFFERLAKLVAP